MVTDDAGLFTFFSSTALRDFTRNPGLCRVARETHPFEFREIQTGGNRRYSKFH